MNSSVKKTLLPAVLCLALFCGCGKHHVKASQSTVTDELARASEKSALAAMSSKDRSDTKSFAENGVKEANLCLKNAPEAAACYYWRAVNTGLYYKIRIIGYQTGLKQMISDCEKVIDLAPSYEKAGAYRILGEIYTSVPQTGAHPDSVIRDLSKAEEFLLKAVEIAPDYPENHLALAEVQLDLKQPTLALKSVQKARDLSALWKNDVSHKEWLDKMNGLEKKLAKAAKKSRGEK